MALNRLRGNTFLLLLLRSGNQTLTTQQEYGDSKDGVTKPNMLRDLLKLANPAYQANKPKTLASYFSKYLAGSPPNSPSYLPFDNVTYKNGLNLRIRNEKGTVLCEMNKFCQKYLDLSQSSMALLVAGMIDLILEDDSIDGEFDIGSQIVSKAQLDTVREIVLQNFLLSVWNNILLSHPDTKEGADTYETWTKEAGDNSPRIITTDIGTQRSQKLTVKNEIMVEEQTKEMNKPENDVVEAEEVNAEEQPRVEVYEVPFTDPTTQQQSVAQFNIVAKDNGVAIGQVFGGLVIGRRENKDE